MTGPAAGSAPEPAAETWTYGGIRATGAGLGVLSGQVGDTAGGWVAAECGVCSVMVVDVQPWVKGGAPLGFCGAGAGVGPFVGEGAVAALDFAVGLGPAGPGAFGGDAEVGADGGP
jgi:hypothetical protein